MILNHKYFKRSINGIFLTLSCLLICYFIGQLTNDPVTKYFFWVFAITLDVSMQLVLAWGRSAWRTRRKTIAVILFTCYAAYVLIYAVLSAVGFFVSEIDAKEKIVSRQVISEQVTREQLANNQRQIAALQTELDREAATGYGVKSEKVIRELRNLKRDQEKISKSFKETSPKLRKSSNDVFGSLSEVLPVSKKFLKVLVFGVSVLMVYLMLVLTAWDVEFGNKNVYGESLLKKLLEVQGNFNETFPVDNLLEKTFGINPDKLFEEVKGIEQPSGDRFFKPKCLEEPKIFSQGFDTFIDYSIRDSGVLNGIQRVSSITDFTLEDCAEYRRQLEDLKIDGQPVITLTQGGGRATFPKEQILEYVRGKT